MFRELVTKKLGLVLEDMDIDLAQWAGPSLQDGTRPAVVTFAQYAMKNKVLEKARLKLRDSPYVLFEDLFVGNGENLTELAHQRGVDACYKHISKVLIFILFKIFSTVLILCQVNKKNLLRFRLQVYIKHLECLLAPGSMTWVTLPTRPFSLWTTISKKETSNSSIRPRTSQRYVLRSRPRSFLIADKRSYSKRPDSTFYLMPAHPGSKRDLEGLW